MPKGVVRSAVDAIGSSIVAGDYPPLSTLPDEEALGARYGLSRSGLREAIKVLSGKGLVRTLRRYGSRVCAMAEWNYLDPDVLSWHLSDPANLPQFLRDIREMRILLEPVASAMAAERGNSVDVQRIVDLAARLPADPAEDSIDADVAFHVSVLRASGNVLIGGFCPAMEVLLHAYLAHMWRLRRGAPLIRNAMNLHQLTARAIAQGDAALARTYAAAMLEVTSLEIDRALSLLPEPSGRHGRSEPHPVSGHLANLAEGWRLSSP